MAIIMVMAMATVSEVNGKNDIIKWDIHTHILHEIDDGAKTLEESLALLRMEADQGIETVVLTPHFEPRNESVSEFLQRRNSLAEELRAAAAHIPVRILLGAEVRFSSELPNLADALCIEGTKALLIELPFYNYPLMAVEIFHRLQKMEILPIIAHPERYAFSGAEELLCRLANGGALLQYNIDSIFRKPFLFKERTRLLKLIDLDLVGFLGSDTHSLDKRPPNWQKALPLFEKKFPGILDICADDASYLFRDIK